jgi:4-amino-4-deoxy-L-arabinose transferase-like glycosyltransferase
MGIGIIYRLEFIFSSLHHDEAYTYMAFAHSLRSAITDYHLPNNHVFHSILVYFSTQLFGNAPWAVRLPAFTAGILLIPAVYSLAKSHYTRLIGLAAGLLVAFSPALIGYSDNARGYTLVALFGLLLLVLGHQVTLSKNRLAWLSIVLISALGMFTVPSFLFPFGILYVWLLLESKSTINPGYSSRGEFIKYWFFSGMCSALLTLLLYLPILIYSGADSLLSNPFVASVSWSGFLETLVQRLRETWSEWTFRVPGWLIILVITGWILSLLLHRKISTTRVPLQLASAVWIVALLVIQRPNAWSKVWMFLLPLVILWAAAGIFGSLGLLKIKKIPLPAILLLLVLAFVGYNASTLLPQLPVLWQAKGDEESAVLFVKADMEGEDGLVVAPPDDAPVWYYAERYGISNALARADVSIQWYVLVNPDEGQTPDSVMEDRGPEGIDAIACVQLNTFGKIVVYQCQETP